MDEHKMTKDEAPASPKDAALMMALESLEHYEKAGLATLKTIDAITAIKQALEETPCVPSPVATSDTSQKPVDETAKQRHEREWQGLTDEEVFDVWLKEMPAPDKVFYQKLCRSVEAKLKEKNT